MFELKQLISHNAIAESNNYINALNTEWSNIIMYFTTHKRSQNAVEFNSVYQPLYSTYGTEFVANLLSFLTLVVTLRIDRNSHSLLARKDEFTVSTNST